MTTHHVEARDFQQEGSAILLSFRLLSEDEQKIAYAILEGMRLQRNLDMARSDSKNSEKICSKKGD